MADRLPPLNALRAFEAAARRGSFRDAATELHVTPAAISHQIKALEDHLGVALFRRLNREVRLTDQGRACLPGVRGRRAPGVRRRQPEGTARPPDRRPPRCRAAPSCR